MAGYQQFKSNIACLQNKMNDIPITDIPTTVAVIYNQGYNSIHFARGCMILMSTFKQMATCQVIHIYFKEASKIIF